MRIADMRIGGAHGITDERADGITDEHTDGSAISITISVADSGTNKGTDKGTDQEGNCSTHQGNPSGV